VAVSRSVANNISTKTQAVMEGSSTIALRIAQAVGLKDMEPYRILILLHMNLGTPSLVQKRRGSLRNEMTLRNGA